MQRSVPFGRAAQSRPVLESEQLDALAARAAAGDREAFATIYDSLVDELYVFMRGQAATTVLAEDLLANTFLKAWRSIRGYKANSRKFRPWIYAIARNELRDAWRKDSLEFPLGDTDVLDERPDSTHEEEARDLVESALGVLTAEQREVVVLRYFAGLSHAGIARIVRKREGAVRALHMRALRRMRKAMSHVPHD